MARQEPSGADIQEDHGVNTLFMIGVAGYAWQVHGFWIGLVTLAGLWAARSVTALIIMGRWARKQPNDSIDEATSSTKMLKRVSRSRWAWVIGVGLLLAASAAETCDQNSHQCRRLF